MAFGIDDAITAAASGITLTDTVVRTIATYRRKGVPVDIERLIEEVRITALQRIDEADVALVQLERTLVEKGVNLDQTLQQIIEETSFWRPFESHRIKRIRTSFNALSDAAYSAIDDIAALLRCLNATAPMGANIVESAKRKQDLQAALLNSGSVRNSIRILHAELNRQKGLLK